MAHSAITTPTALHKRSGALVNAVTPVNASRARLRNENVLVPACRSAGRYGMITLRKPTQAYSPFMKRLRSGSDFSASTTRRSIRRKSPASTGIGTFEWRFTRR